MRTHMHVLCTQKMRLYVPNINTRYISVTDFDPPDTRGYINRKQVVYGKVGRLCVRHES